MCVCVCLFLWFKGTFCRIPTYSMRTPPDNSNSVAALRKLSSSCSQIFSKSPDKHKPNFFVCVCVVASVWLFSVPTHISPPFHTLNERNSLAKNPSTVIGCSQTSVMVLISDSLAVMSIKQVLISDWLQRSVYTFRGKSHKTAATR